MKKLAMLLALVLLVTSFSTGAFADGKFYGCQNNEATFETLQEAHANAPAATQFLDSTTGVVGTTPTARNMGTHPALDDYPEGTAFVYRSANLYGGRAAARLNTVISVFVDKHFDDKDSAFAYLTELGLIDIIDECIGSVILVTPANGKSFAQADQMNYYKLQTAIFSQKASGRDAEGKSVTYADGEYFGGWCYYYVIGIDGGASFLSNYVASTYDFVTRIAGLLLINGKMDLVRKVAGTVPVYLVNANEGTADKFIAANGAEAKYISHSVIEYYNQELPLQKVIVAKDGTKTAAEYIADAYYNYFIKAMRIPVVTASLNSAATAYQGVGSDNAPYALCTRDAMINNKTADGIYLFAVEDDETFADIKMNSGAYLNYWYEYLPEEVLNGTAAEHSIPLFLANHGGGDDARVFVDEIGLLALAGEERIAIVAPDETSLWSETVDGVSSNGICPTVLPMLVEYMLDKYPALDPSRCYTMGYSMGGGGTLKALNGKAQIWASGAVMAASSYVATEEEAKIYETIDLPVMLTTSAFDFALVYTFVSAEHHIASGFEKQINLFAKYNGIDQIEAYDYETYPIIGFDPDGYSEYILGGEHLNHTYYLENDAGVPMIAVNVTEDLGHALYPEYAKVVWNYVKHFSRDTETLESIYNPYVK